jgi:hypothetical protein
MAFPGMENQAAEDAAKAQVAHHRDSQTDTTRLGAVAYHVDMRPTTVIEQSQMGGYDRTTKPVGAGHAGDKDFESVGGRGSRDVIAARELGTQGRK